MPFSPVPRPPVSVPALYPIRPPVFASPLTLPVLTSEENEAFPLFSPMSPPVFAPPLTSPLLASVEFAILPLL